MKFITPLQLAPCPAKRSLTFNPATPLQPAINLAQAARLSQDVDSQIPTSKTTPSPRDSPQQTPGYSPDGGSPPLTPQQKTSVSETRTLPFKQQRTRSPPPDPFDEDESPYFPHVTLSPFSQHESSSRPVSPEPAPKHHRTGSPFPLHVETDNQNQLSTDTLSDDELSVKRPCLDRPLPVPLQQRIETLRPSSPPVHTDDTTPINWIPRPRNWKEKSRTARHNWSQKYVWNGRYEGSE